MKQYLMICDENGMQRMKALFRSETVDFIEVQGMSVSTGNVNLLVTPILAPVTPMPPVAVPETQSTEAPKTDVATEVA